MSMQAGQVLATLQDHELKLEPVTVAEPARPISQGYRQVLADRDAAKVEIKAAELAQAEAQLALAADKLARIQIIAPFAGVIVSGDWSQRLGSPAGGRTGPVRGRAVERLSGRAPGG